MIPLGRTVVVEGKYDRMRVSALFDCPVIETGGFNFLNGGETARMIRKAALETGIVILTDSDPAGLKIRSRIKEIVPDGAVCLDAYVPSVEGREKRKSRPGAAGLLGVEGMTDEQIVKAVTEAAGETPAPERGEPLTAADLYAAGLTGPGCSERRKRFLRELELPEGISNRQLLRYLNGSPAGESARELLAERMP